MMDLKALGWLRKYRVRSLGGDCDKREDDLVQEKGLVLTRPGASIESAGVCLRAEGQKIVV